MSTRSLFYCILLFIVACVAIIRYKHLSTPFKVLAWSAAIILFTSLLDRYLVIHYHTNAPTEQALAAEEYIFYASVYYLLFRNKTVKKIVIISIAVLAIFFPINAIFLQPFLTTFPTNINTPAEALYAVFSLLLFKEMLDYNVKINIIKQSIFWFNTAIFFYASTAFVLLALTNYFSSISFKENRIIFYLWWGIEYLFHIFIGIALLTRSKHNNAANTR